MGRAVPVRPAVGLGATDWPGWPSAGCHLRQRGTLGWVLLEGYRFWFFFFQLFKMYCLLLRSSACRSPTAATAFPRRSPCLMLPGTCCWEGNPNLKLLPDLSTTVIVQVVYFSHIAVFVLYNNPHPQTKVVPAFSIHQTKRDPHTSIACLRMHLKQKHWRVVMKYQLREGTVAPAQCHACTQLCTEQLTGAGLAREEGAVDGTLSGWGSTQGTSSVSACPLLLQMTLEEVFGRAQLPWDSKWKMNISETTSSPLSAPASHL